VKTYERDTAENLISSSMVAAAEPGSNWSKCALNAPKQSPLADCEIVNPSILNSDPDKTFDSGVSQKSSLKILDRF